MVNGFENLTVGTGTDRLVICKESSGDTTPTQRDQNAIHPLRAVGLMSKKYHVLVLAGTFISFTWEIHQNISSSSPLDLNYTKNNLHFLLVY